MIRHIHDHGEGMSSLIVRYILMATMLNGAAVMDAAMLLVAGNETCPQPQTSEHLAAVEIMRLQNILILQNKIDLVKEEAALQQQEEIKKFVAGTVAGEAPIIPISAVLGYNVDIVCEYLCTKIPVPRRDFLSSPHLIVIRSFDVNKPGADARNCKVFAGDASCREMISWTYFKIQRKHKDHYLHVLFHYMQKSNLMYTFDVVLTHGVGQVV